MRRAGLTAAPLKPQSGCRLRERRLDVHPPRRGAYVRGAVRERREGDVQRLAGAVAARTDVPMSVAVGALFGHLSIAGLEAGECARHPVPTT